MKSTTADTKAAEFDTDNESLVVFTTSESVDPSHKPNPGKLATPSTVTRPASTCNRLYTIDRGDCLPFLLSIDNKRTDDQYKHTKNRTATFSGKSQNSRLSY